MEAGNECAAPLFGGGEPEQGLDPDTVARVRLLSDPATYGEDVNRVEVIETSKSWVFLTACEVYKLKKPVENHFQDLTTLEARETNCRTEVRLNRRLAPTIYLGTVPVTEEASGALALAGDGPVVDWLVRMLRLPESCMLDQVILNGQHATDANRERLGKLIRLMAGFYEAAPVAALAPKDYVDLFAQEQASNRAVLEDPRFARDLGALDQLLTRFDAAFETAREELQRRVREGRIVDGHGDLRPEHVCLVDPPVVIDCLEFSDRLRMVDPFDEIAFLGLECERLGAGDIRKMLIDQCAQALDDRPPQSVLLFYEAYRAFLRARQSLAHLLVPQPREPAKWLPKAQDYLAAAERALFTA